MTTTRTKRDAATPPSFDSCQEPYGEDFPEAETGICSDLLYLIAHDHVIPALEDFLHEACRQDVVAGI